MRRGNWQQTFTGGRFWPLDPRPEDIRIEDIAHALSMICRFGGHCRKFYSVAQHSVLVSIECARHAGGRGDPRVQMWGLLHDAAEAYVGDMVRPLKRSPGLEVFSTIEHRIMGCVADAFGLTDPIPSVVKYADDVLCATEARDLMADAPALWELPRDPALYTIVPEDPARAERMFLLRFRELTDAIGRQEIAR